MTDFPGQCKKQKTQALSFFLFFHPPIILSSFAPQPPSLLNKTVGENISSEIEGS